MEIPCLLNFITFQSVCPGETYIKPKSGLHVEALPGIYRKSLSAVEPGKYLNAQAFVDDKLQIAGMMVLDRMRNYLEPYAAEKGPREDGTIGTFNEALAALAGSASARGVRGKVQGGPMLLALVPRVWIRSNTSIADLVVKVIDGTTVTEHPVSVTAGVEAELWLHQEIQGKTFDIVIEDVRFTPFTGSTEGTSFFANCTTCTSHGRYKGIAGSGILNNAETTALQGIRAEVLLTCSLDPVACILLRRYRFAVLYQLGILILQEWEASDRANYFTLHSKEWATAQAEAWNMVELPRFMKTSNDQLHSLIRNLDPDCLTCGNGPNYGTSHG